MAELELRGLSKRYGKLQAVDDVSLSVEAGEFFSLLGPSGCGKTTILRMVAGIVEPDAGAILVGGRDITREPMHGRDMTMVFQNYALFTHMSVFENVAFGLRMRHVGRAEMRSRVEEALALVGLPDVGAKRPTQLSGGQQQRIALARALVVRPRLLLLDEPLSNLDAKLRESLRREVRDILSQIKITTLFVTHDISEVLAMSDRIAVVNRGRIEQVGTPDQIYSAPATRFVAGFVGQSNILEGEVVEAGAAHVDVRTKEGLALRGRSSASLKARDPIWVGIRPERILPMGQGRVASIERVTYLGNLIEYQIRCEGQALLMQRVAGAEPAGRVGDSLTVGWSEDDCVVHSL